MVSAPRCTLLRATEELGLCKMYSDGNMEAFSYDDKDNFKDSGKSGIYINVQCQYCSDVRVQPPLHLFVSAH